MAVTLPLGGSYTWHATNNGADDGNATWVSSNPAVVGISTAGPSATTVTSGLTVGTATLTATDPGSGCVVSVEIEVPQGAGAACQGYQIGTRPGGG